MYLPAVAPSRCFAFAPVFFSEGFAAFALGAIDSFTVAAFFGEAPATLLRDEAASFLRVAAPSLAA
ncbi:MAG: hypothetical protein C4340_06560 [Armatimonadota bacterium]